MTETSPRPDKSKSPLIRRTPAGAPRTRRPLGRPANTSADQTRREILTAARECFAAYGYAATTNKLIAERTGLTTASIYHHFGRKSDLMRAVFEATEAESYNRIRAALEGRRGLVASVDALLDVTHDILSEDSSMAVFLYVVREESQRHQELASISFERPFADLTADIIDRAIADGEVVAHDAKLLRGALAAITVGLAGLSGELNAEAHRIATEGCKRLVAGTLLRPFAD
ncbi:TetR/AcrR family transcriptional regulator [Mycobacterium kyogaense]|uniref:TetR/AcrR family transcriptional regulator n=1 Tax=Mycobacterium kyogaense TaxID=2212479 RepID=UPI0013C3E4BB|nr:TetR/AcrR family transcriptional regulator [Mycobacterium kyogaense]